MFLEYVRNIALLLALSILYGFIINKGKKTGNTSRILSGIIFGSIAVIGMITPINFSKGVIFDGRSIVLSMAGLFGGIIPAGIAAIMTSIYRWHIGGSGVFTGICVIFTSAATGIIFRNLKKNVSELKYYHFYFLGIITHIFMLLWMLTLPKEIAFSVLKNISLPVMILYPLGTVFLGLLLSDQEKRNFSEKKLKENQDFLNDVLNNVESYIFVKDRNYRYTYANKKVCELFGKTLCDIVGKKDDDFFDKSSVEEILKSDKPVIECGDKIIREETNLSSPENTPRTYWVIKIPLKNESGEVYGLCGISTDITELKRLENERIKLQEQLIHSEKLSAIGQLAAGIAHEFNNILAIAYTSAKLIVMEDNNKLSDDSKGSLKAIENAILRGKKIVEYMMSFAKPVPPKKELIKIEDIIDSVIKLQKQQLELENITVLTDYSNSEKIYVDPGQIEQVFLNLIINARHAILPKGKGLITIKTYLKEEEVYISISDTGIGMDDETKLKIFTPFFTTKGAFAKDNLNIKGTGLGLSVTFMIIENHSGRIYAESTEGEGTKFVIVLPAGYSNIQHSFDNEKNNNEQIINDEIPLKVLIVDDEPEFLRSMKKILQINNCDTIVCERGKQAVKLVLKNDFDLIFLDMLLPDMKGEEIFREIKKIKSIPIVFISGQIGLEIENIKQTGAYSFIQKPFEFQQIKDIIAEIRKSRFI
ncbi:response regulator [Candidatus Dependentiae bacterium]|nr:response regulator [Candidatus Dependentiae bacterium]